MAREVQNDVVAIVVKAAKMTSNVLTEAINASLAAAQGKSANKHGKQSLDSLIKNGSSLQNIEVSDKNIKSFESSARKFGIDYALKKVPNEDPPKYVVFFKGKDTEQVYKAFKDYASKHTADRDKPSVIKEIKTIVQEQAQQRSQQRDRSRVKDRGVEH